MMFRCTEKFFNASCKLSTLPKQAAQQMMFRGTAVTAE
jgi:hypothetical protein